MACIYPPQIIKIADCSDYSNLHGCHRFVGIHTTFSNTAFSCGLIECEHEMFDGYPTANVNGQDSPLLPFISSGLSASLRLKLTPNLGVETTHALGWDGDTSLHHVSLLQLYYGFGQPK